MEIVDRNPGLVWLVAGVVGGAIYQVIEAYQRPSVASVGLATAMLIAGAFCFVTLWRIRRPPA
jgi:hypothetical protein